MRNRICASAIVAVGVTLAIRNLTHDDDGAIRCLQIWLLLIAPAASCAYLWRASREAEPFATPSKVAAHVLCVALIYSPFLMWPVTDSLRVSGREVVQFVIGWLAILFLAVLIGSEVAATDGTTRADRLIVRISRNPRLLAIVGTALMFASLWWPISEHDDGKDLYQSGAQWITSISGVGGGLTVHGFDFSGWLLDHCGRAMYFAALLFAFAAFAWKILRPADRRRSIPSHTLASLIYFVAIYFTVDLSVGWTNFLLGDLQSVPTIGVALRWLILALWLTGWSLPVCLYAFAGNIPRPVHDGMSRTWGYFLLLGFALETIMLAFLLDLGVKGLAAFVFGSQVLAASYLEEMRSSVVRRMLMTHAANPAPKQSGELIWESKV